MIVYAIKNKVGLYFNFKEFTILRLATLFGSKKQAEEFKPKYMGLKIVKVKIEEVEE